MCRCIILYARTYWSFFCGKSGISPFKGRLSGSLNDKAYIQNNHKIQWTFMSNLNFWIFKGYLMDIPLQKTLNKWKIKNLFKKLWPFDWIVSSNFIRNESKRFVKLDCIGLGKRCFQKYFWIWRFFYNWYHQFSCNTLPTIFFDNCPKFLSGTLCSINYGP